MILCEFMWIYVNSCEFVLISVYKRYLFKIWNWNWIWILKDENWRICMKRWENW